MTVYVESNFVLEQALQQEQSDSCDAIVNLAASGDISLVIPAFSLAEPHQALALKEKTRNLQAGGSTSISRSVEVGERSVRTLSQ